MSQPFPNFSLDKDLTDEFLNEIKDFIRKVTKPKLFWESMNEEYIKRIKIFEEKLRKSESSNIIRKEINNYPI